MEKTSGAAKTHWPWSWHLFMSTTTFMAGPPGSEGVGAVTKGMEGPAGLRPGPVAKGVREPHP
ncbi:hypothetical protein GCM10018780_87010 [Streptomyces lanatus]|nr:hypothetical protein GCM10018780_87010 [Streptomyces lanatus]